MEKNIYDAVLEYGNKNNISFHMPGHKGKKPECFLEGDFFKLDITEIPGMDNLYCANGIIKKSQEVAAALYDAKRSFFLTGGSTVGVLAAILSCVSDGDKLLVARNCHRSILSGIILSGAEPVYVYPEITDFRITGGMDPEKIRCALDKDKEIRAVVIVSPTYEGIVSDVKKISEITRSAGVYLIVDGAHGAHFPFSCEFPEHPCCADIVISGLHKTLPVFGQCAIMHVYNERLVQKIEAALAMVQTSSPSYLFLASIDKFFSDYKLYDFDGYIQNLLGLHKRLRGLRNIKLLDRGGVGSFSIYDIDISRLVFLFDSGEPEKFASILREKYSVEIEAYYPYHAIAISSVADTTEDLEALSRALCEIDDAWEYPAAGEKPVFEALRPEMIYSPRKAWSMHGEYVDVTECAGRVAAEVIMTYPPGIAAVCPGEVINKEVARFLIYCVENDLAVHGLCGSHIFVLEESRAGV